MTRNSMTLEMDSRPENVGVARLSVGAFASGLDFTLSELDEIKVAVSEAVTNAIVHGYPGTPGRVRIEAEIVDRELRLTISDWGEGIADVALARTPSYSTDPERMGLGFVFMESFMDELEVASAVKEGTVVKMTKRCQGP